MNILSRERQEQILNALVEGVSIRSTERMTHTHRVTIMRLLVDVGEQCQQVLDERLRGCHSRKQHRVIGFFGPGPHQFTSLIGCIHKQRIYAPANALETAVQRKRLIEHGEGTVRERKIEFGPTIDR